MSPKAQTAIRDVAAVVALALTMCGIVFGAGKLAAREYASKEYVNTAVRHTEMTLRGERETNYARKDSIEPILKQIQSELQEQRTEMREQRTDIKTILRSSR